MRTVIFAVLAALSLGVATVQTAQAASIGTPQSNFHSGPYDSGDFGPGGSELDGGWG